MTQPEGQSPEPVPWTHPDWRPWRANPRDSGSHPASNPALTDEGVLVRLHWTHPDWRPWRRSVRIAADQAAPGIPAAPAAGAMLVKIPWSHPSWRPWRRWARVEAPTPDQPETRDPAKEAWLHPDRLPWARLSLLMLLLAAAVATPVGAVVVWRRLANPARQAERLRGVAEIHLELNEPDAASRALERALEINPGNRAAARLLAELQRKAGETDEELETLRRSHQAAPEDPIMASRYAGALLDRNQPQQAWEVMSPLTARLLERRDARRAPALLVAGRAALGSGAMFDAVSLLRGAAQSAEGEAMQGEALLALGEALAATDRLADAREVLEGARRLLSGKQDEVDVRRAGVLARIGLLDEALSTVRPITQRPGPVRAAASRLLGELLLGRGQRDQPRAFADELAAEGKDEASAAYIRAMLAMTEGNLALAHEQATRLVELEPKSAPAHLLLAQVSVRRRDLPAAKHELLAALEHGSQEPALEVMLLEVECGLGEWDQAEERALRLAAEPRTRPRALEALTAVLARPGAGLERSLAALQALRERDPEDLLLGLYVALLRLLGGDEGGVDALNELSGKVDPSVALAALARLQAGRTDVLEAIETLTTLIERTPRLTSARVVLGLLYEGLGRDDLAAREYDQVLAFASHDRAARLGRARVAFRAGDLARVGSELSVLPPEAPQLQALADLRLRQGNPTEAVALLETAATLASRDPRVVAALARAQVLAGRSAEAVETYRAARAIESRLVQTQLEGLVHLLEGRAVEACQALEQAAAATGDPRFRLAVVAALVQAGSSGHALETLQTQLQATPDDPLLRLLEAALLVASNRQADVAQEAPRGIPAEVWTAVRQESRADRSTVPVGLELLVCRAFGWTREAEASARKLDATGALVDAWLALQAATGELRVSLLRRLTAAMPGWSEGELVLAAELARAGDHDGALAVLDRLPPGDPRARLQRGLTLDAMGRVPEALAEYEQIVQGERVHPLALNNLAVRLGASPDTRPRALELARKAVALAPREPQFHETLGWILHQAGQHEQAIEHMARSVELLPRQAKYRLRLARALVATGQDRRARNMARVALLSPSLSEAEAAEARALIQEIEARTP